MTKMKLHTAVAQTLIDAGQSTVFGLLGDGNMQYCAAYMDLGGRFVGAIHEGNAVSMADGHARATDGVGVVSMTAGPAATNALTALTEAVRARTPVLLMTGDTPLRRNFVQQVDLAAVASVAGATYRRVLKAEHVVDDLMMALRQVATSRLPMLFDIPAALLNEDVDYEVSNFSTAAPAAPMPNESDLDVAMGILAAARRPVVLAGLGAVLGDAREELVALAADLGAPLATTLLAKDFFADVPGHVGVCGTVAHDVGIEIISSADCLVVFGASLNDYTAAHGDLLRDKAIVQVDVSPLALGRHCPVDVGLVGDAATTATAMRAMLKEAEITPRTYNSAALQDRLEALDPREDFTAVHGTNVVDMRTAIIELDKILPANRSVVTDVGRFMQAPWRYLHVGDGGRFQHTANFGSIGLALPTAIGTAIAARSDVTVVVAGDGGVATAYLELATAVREKLRLIVVVLNDGCYGAEYTKLADAGLDPCHSILGGWPDLSSVANSLGCHVVTVTSLKGLGSVSQHADRGQFPLVIDVHADPTVDIGVLS